MTGPTWEDAPSQSSPLNAANLEAIRAEWEAYADSVAAAGVLLDSASITSNFTQTGAGASDVTGLAVTVTVGTRPIQIRFSCDSFFNSSASGIGTIGIQEGATVLAARTSPLGTAVAAGNRETAPLTPSPGSHTYKIVLGQVVTGNTTLSAAATSPATITVLEL